MAGKFTYALAEDMMHAMEDEKHSYAFDMENMLLIEKEENNFDEERFVSIPEWGAKCGFRAMLDFVSSVHQKAAREKLLAALYSRRNVFHLFKSEIKNFPLLEKKWHAYKKREMLDVIKSWWDETNAERKLESLPLEFEECDTSDIIKEDFRFKIVEDKAQFLSVLEKIAADEGENLSALERAVQKVWRNECAMCAKKDLLSCVAFAAYEEVAALIAAFIEKEEAFLAFLKVKEDFRSLGLSKALLENLSRRLKKVGITRLAVLHSVLEDMAAFLESAHFQKEGSAFFLTL